MLGTTTLSIMTLSIATLSITVLSAIMMMCRIFIIMLSAMGYAERHLGLFATLSINNTQHSDSQHNSIEGRYAVIILRVVMLNAVVHSVIMLNIIMLSVIMLIVMAPCTSFP